MASAAYYLINEDICLLAPPPKVHSSRGRDSVMPEEPQERTAPPPHPRRNPTPHGEASFRTHRGAWG